MRSTAALTSTSSAARDVAIDALAQPRRHLHEPLARVADVPDHERASGGFASTTEVSIWRSGMFQ